MNQRKRHITLLIALVPLLLLSCSKTAGEAAFIDFPIETLRLGSDLLGGAESGSFSVCFPVSANCAWEANVLPCGDGDPSWLGVSPGSGLPGDTEVTVTAELNGSRSERKAMIRFSGGGIKKDIIVIQEGNTNN